MGYKIKKPIRLIELFAGIGTQAIALKDLGVPFEYWKTVEFDKFAVKSQNAIHGQNIEPIDIKDLRGKDLNIVDTDKYEYIMSYSFPCFTGDTLVLTRDGYKQIKDIRLGDYVLSHDDKYHEVTASSKTGHKNVYKINAMGSHEIKCTENHKFYTRKLVRHYPTYEDGRRGNIRTFEEPVWKECAELTKKDYLGIAINQNSIIPTYSGFTKEWVNNNNTITHFHSNKIGTVIDKEGLLQIGGRWLGNGYYRNNKGSHGIVICCGKHKFGQIEPYLESCGFHYNCTEERTVFKYHVCSVELQTFFQTFGNGAMDKHIPGFVFDLPVNLCKALLDGYMSADGSFDGVLYKASSVSKELVYGIGQLIAKVYHRPYSIYYVKRKPTCVIEGRTVNQKDTQSISWKLTNSKQDKAFYEDGYLWIPINSIKDCGYTEDVYDITVDEAHSFTANGVIAHNCQDLSVAGKQAGMNKNSGTRSSLLWEVQRLLEELDELPRILLLENVPQLHNKKNMPHFQEWIDFLSSKGYRNYWQDLNAKDYGIPQNRNRCFMISILDSDEPYVFPDPIPLTTVMADYLEDEVDEKYQIKGEKVDALIETLFSSGKLPELPTE